MNIVHFAPILPTTDAASWLERMKQVYTSPISQLHTGPSPVGQHVLYRDRRGDGWPTRLGAHGPAELQAVGVQQLDREGLRADPGREDALERMQPPHPHHPPPENVSRRTAAPLFCTHEHTACPAVLAILCAVR